MAEQPDSKHSSFTSYYDEPEYPLMINPPRGKLLRVFLYHAAGMFLLSLLSFHFLLYFTIPVLVFILFKHHALSKIWTAYKYSHFLFWSVTVIMIILFFVSSYFIRTAFFKWVSNFGQL